MSEEIRRKSADSCYLPGLGPDNTCDKLAKTVKSGDKDLLEAFPAMLANAAEAGELNLAALNDRLDEDEKKALKSLIFFSLGLYKHLGLKFSWTRTLFEDFAPRLTANYSDRIRLNSEIDLGGSPLDPAGAKDYFRKNFKKNRPGAKSSLEAGEKLDLELAVARLFTPRQKDLFLKRLRGKKMTKTEKEYFSRIIKKKLQALANEDLLRLARKVLE